MPAACILEHLHALNPNDFVDLDDADVPTLLEGQASTAREMLAQLGSPEHVLEENHAQAVRDAFGSVTALDSDPRTAKQQVLRLRVPEAVKHLSGMLTQYDWDYVEQAKELRGYVAAKLLEESKHPDAKIRLRALQLLGTLTEVGSFTERIEVTKKDANIVELEARVRAKLAALVTKTADVETVEAKSESTPKD